MPSDYVGGQQESCGRMNILFFIEPAIFALDPNASVGHLHWPTALEPAIRRAGYDLVIAGSDLVCRAWENLMEVRGHEPRTFRIDPFEPLADFQYSFSAYRSAQASSDAGAISLEDALLRCRDLHQPKIVFHSSQQSSLRKIFADRPVIGIEQGFLMRIGHQERVCFDPCGHQSNSILEIERHRITEWPLSESTARDVENLMRYLQELVVSDPARKAALAELDAIAEGKKIALLALQTPQAIPAHYGYDATDPASLIARWSSELPDGWIGVPTYHFGFQLSEAMEEALSGTPRLKFLSRPHSVDMTETLLTRADALVTVSSTTAMTAMLFGKRQVTVGKAPMHSWGACKVQDLDQGPTLTAAHRISTFAFLTNRYSWPLWLISQDAPVANLLNGFLSEGKAWLFGNAGFDGNWASLRFSK